jgi:hypothetical protein
MAFIIREKGRPEIADSNTFMKVVKKWDAY